MEKTWEEMTQSEKIEDLRRDVKSIFALLNQFRDAIAQDQQGVLSRIEVLQRNGPLLHGLHERIRELEKRAGIEGK